MAPAGACKFCSPPAQKHPAPTGTGAVVGEAPRSCVGVCTPLDWQPRSQQYLLKTLSPSTLQPGWGSWGSRQHCASRGFTWGRCWRITDGAGHKVGQLGEAVRPHCPLSSLPQRREDARRSASRRRVTMASPCKPLCARAGAAPSPAAFLCARRPAAVGKEAAGRNTLTSWQLLECCGVELHLQSPARRCRGTFLPGDLDQEQDHLIGC